MMNIWAIIGGITASIAAIDPTFAGFIMLFIAVSIVISGDIDIPEPDDIPEEDIGDASSCRVWGTEEINCGPIDTRVCAWVPAEVPAAWTTAADCPANPAGLVVGGGDANGVNAEAVDEEAAYPYIAAAS